ncbi:hypothetical protein AM1_0351 [Acaryochloris marina MBIC11017]|uniref:Uncharacterized protein n=1 Tax=Acaryochloris marina (strain MBIC 11017) TaxID=329726 RepID=B0C9X0_ACAM1|nr:hypothetical protein AM1_0351 [Acaryochloris marina MBIC11017]
MAKANGVTNLTVFLARVWSHTLLYQQMPAMLQAFAPFPP